MALSGTGISTGGWYAPLSLTTSANLPISLSAWIRMPTGAPNTTFCSLSSDDVTGNAAFVLRYYNGNLYAEAYDDANSGEGGVYAAWTPPTTWQHVCIQWISSNAWNIWVSGKQLTTTSLGLTLGTTTFRQIRAGWTTQSVDYTSPFSRSFDTNYGLGTGQTTLFGEPVFTTGAAVAEMSVWSGTLLSAEIVELAEGENPLNLNGGRLRAYYRLRGSLAGSAPGNLVGMAPSNITTDPIWTDDPVSIRKRATGFVFGAPSGPYLTVFSADFSVDFGYGPVRLGNLGLTQDAQTLSGSSGQGITGSLTVTQAAQVLSSSGQDVIYGTLTANQAGQALVATGGATNVGSLNVQQQNNTLLAGGTGAAEQGDCPWSRQFSIDFGPDPYLYAGVTSVQSNNTLAAAGNTGSGGNLAITQAAQTLTGAGGVLLTGTFSAVQSAQAMSASGAVGTGGRLTVTQSPQAIAASGGVATGASLTATQAAQIVGATASSTITGATATMTQAPQTISAQASATAGASANVTQANQSLAGAGAVNVTASLSVTQDTQTVNTSAGASGSGGLAMAQAPQTLAATGTSTVTGATATLTQAPQIIGATGVSSIVGAFTATQATQTSTISGKVATTGALTATTNNASMAATGTSSVIGTLTATQPGNTLIGASTPTTGATLTATQNNQTLTGAGGVTLSGTLSAIQANATLGGAVAVDLTALLNMGQDVQSIVATANVWTSADGTLTATQANNTLVAKGQPLVAGSLTSTQASQTMYASGTATSPDPRRVTIPTSPRTIRIPETVGF